DRLDLLEVADGGRGGVRVDVVDGRVDVLQRHLHAADRAFARRLHHVVPVRGRAVADQLAIDARPARLGVTEFLQHDDASAAGNHKAVAVLVVGPRSYF